MNELLPPTANAVNTLGLFLDIVGAGLLWKFGLPAEINRQGHIYRRIAEIDEAEKSRALRYDRISSWAFLLLVVGFALQIISNFMSK